MRGPKTRQDPAEAPPPITGPGVLNEPTLVLNRSWIPIDTTTVRSALSLIANESARAVQPETYQLLDFEAWSGLPVIDTGAHVRTVSLRIRAPEIIVLSAYDKLPVQQVPFTRRNLYRRDGFQCQYCRRRFSADKLTIDHVVPKSRGGPSSWRNCVVACLTCNVHKGDRVPRTAGMPLQRAPRSPRWSPCLGITRTSRKASWEHFVGPKFWKLEMDS